MKRIFDFLTALILAGIMALPIIIIALAVKLSSAGPVIYWPDRMGKVPEYTPQENEGVL
jgi:O-antigen biosynthesis protein WbqP